jgi:hypothetical protein
MKLFVPLFGSTHRTEATQALQRAINRAEIETSNLGRRVGERTDGDERLLWKDLIGHIELSKATLDLTIDQAR